MQQEKAAFGQQRRPSRLELWPLYFPKQELTPEGRCEVLATELVDFLSSADDRRILKVHRLLGKLVHLSGLDLPSHELKMRLLMN